MLTLPARYIPFYALLLSCIALKAQQEESKWLSATSHYGFIIPHSVGMEYLINGHTRGGETSLYKTTGGKHKWERDYNNPDIGISVLYLFLANPSQLGFGLGIHPYVNFPLIKGKHSGLKFKAATSVGYLSKIFDPVNNFKNIAIGSHLNGFVNLRLNAYHDLGKDLRIEYGIGLSHFSNGAYKMPNLGINIPTLALGLAYKCSSQKVSLPEMVNDSLKSNYEVVCVAGGCKAEVPPPLHNNYLAFTFSSSIDWVKLTKHRFLIGAELGYNGGNAERLEENTPLMKTRADLLQEGIKLGYAFRIGQLELPLEFGYYLHTLCKSNGMYFHRIGLRYYMTNNILLNLTLKTHWAVADYWEFGVGYRFRKKK